jgi:hypothetical protein
MTDQPKLQGKHEPWEHVAREFGDEEMVTQGLTYNTWETMCPVNDAYYVGDYVPAEPVCREVVRLRAKLDAIHRWVSRHAEIVDSDPEHPPYLNEAAEILQEFFDGKEPDA